MGKYTHVVKNLKRLDGEEPDYQEKVNFVKAHIVSREGFTRQASTLAREYIVIRKEKDRLNDELYDANLRLMALQQLMADQFEAEGLDNIRVDGQPISIFLEPYARITDKTAFRLWCAADEDLCNKLTLQWQTTNELVKKMLLAGEELPPGVEAFAATKIRLGSV